MKAISEGLNKELSNNMWNLKFGTILKHSFLNIGLLYKEQAAYQMKAESVLFLLVCPKSLSSLF